MYVIFTHTEERNASEERFLHLVLAEKISKVMTISQR